MFGHWVVSHGDSELDFSDLVQGNVMLVGNILSLVFMLGHNATSAECEWGASRFWSADDLVRCHRGTLSANAFVHRMRNTLMEGESVLGWKIVIQR